MLDCPLFLWLLVFVLNFITDFTVEINGNCQTHNPANFNYLRYGDQQQIFDKQSLKMTTSYMKMGVESILKILWNICLTITSSLIVCEFRTVNQQKLKQSFWQKDSVVSGFNKYVLTKHYQKTHNTADKKSRKVRVMTVLWNEM